MIQFIFKNLINAAKFFGKRGRGGNSLPLQPLSFPPRPSGLGFCETPQVFRSRLRLSASVGQAKKVRAFSIIAHQTGFCKFLEVNSKACSPRLRARLARNWAVKSNGGAKSQETIFSEMRRFVITKLCIKINFYSTFLRKISRFAGLRRFFVPSRI